MGLATNNENVNNQGDNYVDIFDIIHYSAHSAVTILVLLGMLWCDIVG